VVTRRSGWLRWVGATLIAGLPSFTKVPLYRLFFGYRIGRSVRIGFSPIVGVKHLDIGDYVRIGHLNAFVDVVRIEIGAHSRIGFLNIFRGGDKVSIGEYSTVLRRNVVNSIPDPEVVNVTNPVFAMGVGAVLTSAHWVDFTDRVVLGPHCIVGGRGSSLWTHNRQRTRPIEIGAHTYLGSEIRVAPGVSIGAGCIVALGSVLLESFREPLMLIAGNPAAVVRALTDRDVYLVTRKTRADIPSDLAERFLPVELQGRLAGADSETARSRSSASESLIEELR
jgi:acetyltransferase-like isoleucine patch superfamily enzyme